MQAAEEMHQSKINATAPRILGDGFWLADRFYSGLLKRSLYLSCERATAAKELNAHRGMFLHYLIDHIFSCYPPFHRCAAAQMEKGTTLSKNQKYYGLCVTAPPTHRS